MSTLFESTGPSLKDLEVPDFAGRRVWLVGIGGCGMSGLAQMLKRRGAEVSGSDMTASSATEALESEGITVRIGHAAEQLPAPCDLVIASAAIKSVVTNTAVKGIDPVSTREGIVTFTTRQAIIAKTACQRVVAFTPIKLVIFIAAIKTVVTGFAIKSIVARAA